MHTCFVLQMYLSVQLCNLICLIWLCSADLIAMGANRCGVASWNTLSLFQWSLMRGCTASRFPEFIAVCAAFIVATPHKWFDAARIQQGVDAGSTSMSVKSAMWCVTDSRWHQADQRHRSTLEHLASMRSRAGRIPRLRMTWSDRTVCKHYEAV